MRVSVVGFPGLALTKIDKMRMNNPSSANQKAMPGL
jgi:hypothetical protein